MCGKPNPNEIDCTPKVPRSWLDDANRHTRLIEEELQFVKRNCHRHHQPLFLGCNGRHTEVRYYAQTVEQQKMANMLARARNSTAQLLKDLTA
jgi:hypothetical protein